MRLYIARHGETLWNREKRLQGSTDVELNEKGIALAELTGKALAQVPFHRVFASPLKRAVVTARLMTGGRELPFETDERLKEISDVYKRQDVDIIHASIDALVTAINNR